MKCSQYVTPTVYILHITYPCWCWLWQPGWCTVCHVSLLSFVYCGFWKEVTMCSPQLKSRDWCASLEGAQLTGIIWNTFTFIYSAINVFKSMQTGEYLFYIVSCQLTLLSVFYFAHVSPTLATGSFLTAPAFLCHPLSNVCWLLKIPHSSTASPGPFLAPILEASIFSKSDCFLTREWY